jgi:hypothetical protein
MMDKLRKPNDSQCYTPLSESFRIYLKTRVCDMSENYAFMCKVKLRVLIVTVLKQSVHPLVIIIKQMKERVFTSVCLLHLSV